MWFSVASKSFVSFCIASVSKCLSFIWLLFVASSVPFFRWLSSLDDNSSSMTSRMPFAPSIQCVYLNDIRKYITLDFSLWLGTSKRKKCSVALVNSALLWHLFSLTTRQVLHTSQKLLPHSWVCVCANSDSWYDHCNDSTLYRKLLRKYQHFYESLLPTAMTEKKTLATVTSTIHCVFFLVRSWISWKNHRVKPLCYSIYM